MINEKRLIEEIDYYIREANWGEEINEVLGWCIEWIENQPKVGGWIPCSEGLPEELTPVNVTWVNRKPAPYYENIKNIPFTATAVYCNKKWFWWSNICEDILAEYGRNDAELVDGDVEIIAWQTLPEPYEESEEK